MRFEQADSKYTIQIKEFALELVSFICKEQIISKSFDYR